MTKWEKDEYWDTKIFVVPTSVSAFKCKRCMKVPKKQMVDDDGDVYCERHAPDAAKPSNIIKNLKIFCPYEFYKSKHNRAVSSFPNVNFKSLNKDKDKDQDKDKHKDRDDEKKTNKKGPELIKAKKCDWKGAIKRFDDHKCDCPIVADKIIKDDLKELKKDFKHFKSKNKEIIRAVKDNMDLKFDEMSKLIKTLQDENAVLKEAVKILQDNIEKKEEESKEQEKKTDKEEDDMDDEDPKNEKMIIKQQTRTQQKVYLVSPKCHWDTDLLTDGMKIDDKGLIIRKLGYDSSNGNGFSIKSFYKGKVIISIKIVKTADSQIGIGIVPEDNITMETGRYFYFGHGNLLDSIGYWGYDGEIHCNDGLDTSDGLIQTVCKYGENDVISILINFIDLKCIFYRNNSKQCNPVSLRPNKKYKVGVSMLKDDDTVEFVYNSY